MSVWKAFVTMLLGLEPPSEWCVATSHFLIYPVYNDFLSTSSISTTILRGTDPFLTPVEGSHVQKTRTAGTSKVCNWAGVGSQTFHFNRASWDRQTALSTGVKVRGWEMPYWARAETQRVFFRPLVQSCFLPLSPACSLEKGNFTVCSLQRGWLHSMLSAACTGPCTNHSQHRWVSRCWLGCDLPTLRVLPTASSFPATQISSVSSAVPFSGSLFLQ